MAAHPRSRGENSSARHTRLIRLGSSPLTRGKLPDEDARKAALEAHPRSRGENTLTAGGARRMSGSSPLTRGKPASGRP